VPRPLRHALLHTLFALSGAAGLIFQVTWVRSFATVFGSSVPSASMVTATFLAGLGLGGWLAGRWADRHRGDLLRAWAVAELLVAVLGIAVCLGTPALLPISAALASHQPSPEGWLHLSPLAHLLRAGLVAAVLLPPSVAMGTTLTLLVRHRVHHPDQASRHVGWLYAANTLGAAVGAACTDTLLVPRLGLTATQGLAAAVDAAVGLGALLLALSARGALPRRAAPSVAWVLPRGPVVALFLTGFAAMGLELVWFRFLAGALGPYRAVFSLLLATVLVGQAVGAALAGELHRRVGRPALLFAAAQGLLVLGTVAGLLAHDPYELLVRQHAVVDAFTSAGPVRRAWLLHQVNGLTIVGLAALPSLAMGAAFPLANALAQRDAARVGRAVGGLYLATTLGNVAGSLLAGFVLLPGPGLQATTALCCAVALLAPAALIRTPRAGLALLPGALALAALLVQPPHTLLWSTFPHGRARDEPLLAVREGLEQILVVTGTPVGPVRLWTSGHPMTSTTPHAQRYMRAMAHVPLWLRDDPREVLVICVGAGNTVHAATLHPSVQRVDAVDLSAEVLSVNHLFAHAHGGVLQHDKVTAYVDDGRHHLLLQPPGRYDLITHEPPPRAVAGVSSLYSRDLYALAASRLAPGGILSQWLPAYQVPGDDVRSLVRSFVDVFPHAVLLMGSGRELVLLGSDAPLTWSPETMQRRLAERPEVLADLRRIGLHTPTELAATFAADRATLVAATAEAPPVTDDRPFLESAQQSHLVDTRLPADLFAPRRLDRWSPQAVDDPDVRRIVRLTEALFRSEAFLRYRSAVPDRTSVLPPPDLSPDTLDTLTRSEGLVRLLVAPDALALRAAELWDLGQHDAARRHLEAAKAQAPGHPLWSEIERGWADGPLVVP
jgi:spermidine synthase